MIANIMVETVRLTKYVDGANFSLYRKNLTTLMTMGYRNHP